MKFEYDLTNAEQSKFYRLMDALDLPTNLDSFEVSTMDEISNRIEKAEENADYIEHEIFWKELDNQCLKKQIWKGV